MPETLSGAVQSGWPGDRVELWTLDATSIGGTVYRFVNGTPDAQPVLFGGVSYTPYPVEAEGFARSGDGERPTPALRLGNDRVTVLPLLIAYDYLRGCKVTRTRTFSRFLDGEADGDPTAFLSLDLYEVDRPTWIKAEVALDLRSATDVRGRLLPVRTAVRDYCDHTYRRWTGAAFDYTGVTCPYVGGASFDAQGSSVSSALDQCSKQVGTGCRKRFGSATLPYSGYPGLARSR